MHCQEVARGPVAYYLTIKAWAHSVSCHAFAASHVPRVCVVCHMSRGCAVCHAWPEVKPNFFVGTPLGFVREGLHLEEDQSVTTPEPHEYKYAAYFVPGICLRLTTLKLSLRESPTATSRGRKR